MDEFKLRSIEEFDSDFVAEWKEAKAAADAEKAKAETDAQIAAAKATLIGKPSLIPEMGSNEAEETKVSPAIGDTPLYTSNSMSDSPVVAYGEEPQVEIKEKVKLSKGALAGKIVSIILLAATVVVFLLGCFVSVFLDNKGQDLAGYTFSTLSADIEKLEIKKGDMIIAKKMEATDYASGNLVAIPVQGDGCSIVSVSSSYVMGESAQLTYNDLTSGYGQTATIDSESSLGVVQSYIPSLGGLISFAIQNAILVCILFVLLSALWCLLLVLIEKSQYKKSRDAMDEEYNSEPTEFVLNIEDNGEYDNINE